MIATAFEVRPIRDLGDLATQGGAPIPDVVIISSSTLGPELTAAVASVRRRLAPAPVLLITEPDMDDDALEQVLEAGVADFVVPPLRGPEIRSRLRRLIDRRQELDRVVLSL